jgi:hypothetical protein
MRELWEKPAIPRGLLGVFGRERRREHKSGFSLGDISDSE